MGNDSESYMLLMMEKGFKNTNDKIDMYFKWTQDQQKETNKKIKEMDNRINAIYRYMAGIVAVGASLGYGFKYLMDKLT